MNNDEIERQKAELIKEYWTEDFHYGLKELDHEVAKKIVESMNHLEISRKINVRRSQEDYIADYLGYLWEISEASFWKHVIISLNIEVGLLWSDNMLYFNKLCNERIPNDVLIAVLNFAVGCKGNCGDDIGVIGCVIKAQVERFGRLSEIKNYVSQLKKELQDAANTKINEMINKKCNYLSAEYGPK
ncbi:MAG: hypothetical protein ACUZ8E_13285 [Candidatus Anammoxibacter sp.]